MTLYQDNIQTNITKKQIDYLINTIKTDQDFFKLLSNIKFCFKEKLRSITNNESQPILSISIYGGFVLEALLGYLSNDIDLKIFCELRIEESILFSNFTKEVNPSVRLYRHFPPQRLVNSLTKDILIVSPDANNKVPTVTWKSLECRIIKLPENPKDEFSIEIVDPHHGMNDFTHHILRLTENNKIVLHNFFIIIKNFVYALKKYKLPYVIMCKEHMEAILNLGPESSQTINKSTLISLYVQLILNKNFSELFATLEYFKINQLFFPPKKSNKIFTVLKKMHDIYDEIKSGDYKWLDASLSIPVETGILKTIIIAIFNYINKESTSKIISLEQYNGFLGLYYNYFCNLNNNGFFKNINKSLQLLLNEIKNALDNSLNRSDDYKEVDALIKAYHSKLIVIEESQLSIALSTNERSRIEEIALKKTNKPIFELLDESQPMELVNSSNADKIVPVISYSNNNPKLSITNPDSMLIPAQPLRSSKENKIKTFFPKKNEGEKLSTNNNKPTQANYSLFSLFLFTLYLYYVTNFILKIINNDPNYKLRNAIDDFSLFSSQMVLLLMLVLFSRTDRISNAEFTSLAILSMFIIAKLSHSEDYCDSYFSHCDEPVANIFPFRVFHSVLEFFNITTPSAQNKVMTFK